jgi:hypothetical protein
MSAYVTSSGTTVAISTTPPASSVDSLAEISALTYEIVTGVMTLGTFGDVRNLVTFSIIGDGRVRKLRGAADAGTLTFQVAFDSEDAGQLAMIAASDGGDEFAFQVITNDGQPPNPNSEWYFRGLVTSSQLNVENNDSVLSMTFNVAVNSQVWRDLSAAGP